MLIKTYKKSPQFSQGMNFVFKEKTKKWNIVLVSDLFYDWINQ